MNQDEKYMSLCIELAKLGAMYVAPNPMVGAVLVYEDRVIAEGYHEQYGQAHAEVNCINSVASEHRHLIPQSTIYVSLEPCAHHGKTPPCADLIIANKIKRVVVGCRDPFEEVNGKGIEKLQAARIDVSAGVLEKECLELNKRFFTFHTKHRPYIILKWAQTANEKIASGSAERLLISNIYSNRLVHKWRSEEMAILVGTSTALLDDPSLTNRLWIGNNPKRLVIDMDLSLPTNLKIFNTDAPTIIFNTIKHADVSPHGLSYYQVTNDVSIVHQVLNACYQQKIQSIIVEGGARLLQSFINEGVWDEARIISNESLTVEGGLPAPWLDSFQLISSTQILNDRIDYYTHLV